MTYILNEYSLNKKICIINLFIIIIIIVIKVVIN